MGAPKTKVHSRATSSSFTRARFTPPSHIPLPEVYRQISSLPDESSPIASSNNSPPRLPVSQWSVEEEDALRAGVEKYGSGKWRFIQKDTYLSSVLHLRSNVDLKVRDRPEASGAVRREISRAFASTLPT